MGAIPPFGSIYFKWNQPFGNSPVVAGNILINTLWDVVTLPINGAYQFVKFIGATIDGFDTSVHVDGITMPIEIHPRNRAHFENRNGLVAEYKLWPDGKIYARLRFELNLIVPIDHNQDQLMTTS